MAWQRVKRRSERFYGKGVAFPFRVNPNTGGVQTTVGNNDAVGLALEYLEEGWTIREDTTHDANHIAEAVCHILHTIPGEHDTLPEFGSNLYQMLFEPNSDVFNIAAGHYMRFAAKRWEKRAEFPEDAIKWAVRGSDTDEGKLGVKASIQFAPQQNEGNQVYPFATTRDARSAEYPANKFDLSSHDFKSRYWEAPIETSDNVKFNRFMSQRVYEPKQDDSFYVVKRGDTWLLISWELYGDVRFWPYLVDFYVYDIAQEGAPRESSDFTGDPPIGEELRVPSRTRLLMEISA